MKKHSSNRAILILESPWELDSSDSNRSSVFPFVDGVSKYSGDIEVYHANFYDKNSFEKALKCLCKTKFKSTIVYIAAHGYKRKICDVSLNDVLFRIGDMSRLGAVPECRLKAPLIGRSFSGVLHRREEGVRYL